ncbi:CAP domain-containing protein [Novosphingobium piscinae]|uniref:SCP-like extracellular n=1 Tax=Novosphingobium piscinae TaxID=1507448 RepID=A0A7X1KP63_9SPHN|nr:CAP domain-containing protein [Novosphingobium piscinae]MBC2668158.1 SCP-like extracellular [Novosphingobium piscinae]
MVRFPHKALLAAAALALGAPALLGSTSFDGGFEQRVLAAHNLERSRMGVGPLRWNPRLADNAQRWADYLAATGRFEHAPENRLNPEGENLWAGTRSYFTPEAMVDAWVREKRHFRPGVFPNNSLTGQVEDVGHYTQLIWRATGEVGCALARGRQEDVLVCRYAEAGNWKGERPL